MGIQTITGVVKDTNGDPWGNRVVEVAFSDGYVALSPLNVVGRTDTNGAFRLQVDNNTTAVHGAILRLPDDSLFGFDLDPEDTTVDLGDLVASGVAGAARLVRVESGVRVLRVFITQTSGAPVFGQVREDTLGGVPQRIYLDLGSYSLESPEGEDLFPEGRTTAFLSSPYNYDEQVKFFAASVEEGRVLIYSSLLTGTVDGPDVDFVAVPTDGILRAELTIYVDPE